MRSRRTTSIAWFPAWQAFTAKCSRHRIGSRAPQEQTSGEEWGMGTSTAEQLKRAVATLNKLFRLARDAGLADTAQFIAMAKLHLLMDLNGVSDKEFRVLCDHLEGKAAKPSHLAPSRGATARNRREAE